MMVFAYMDVYNLFKIVSGEEIDPANNRPEVESSDIMKEFDMKCENWRYRHSLARAFLLFNVDSTIAPQITCYLKTDKMWKKLCDLFNRKYSLHALVKSVVGIKCESISNIADHIAKYNELWARPVEPTTKTPNEKADSIEAASRPLANSPKAKGSLFLTTLPEEMVDNLKSKDNLTYDDVCSRLMELSISTNNLQENTAFLMTSDESDEIAYPASLSSGNSHKWIFDLFPFSHLSGNLEVFENLHPYEGSIRLGDNKKIEVARIGIVRLKDRLPHGSMVKVTLHDVLYAPELKCSLISWET